MNTEYWLQKWQSKEIGFNQLQPNKLMQRYFPSLKLTPGSCVFVPLCGQSIDMLWLASQGYRVIGVEVSQLACHAFFKDNKIPFNIREIKDFTLYNSDQITIFAGDFFKLNQAILDKIDAVYDRAALIALPIDVRKSYSEHLIKLMPPATAMFLITMVYPQNQMQGPPFSVDEQEVKALYSAHFKIEQIYSQQAEVPPHLQAKGLAQATEQVYSLIRQNKTHKDRIKQT